MNGWSIERRKQQSAAIQSWHPWTSSTGARTPEGRATSSRNAFRYTHRKGWLFACWLGREANKLRAGKPYASMDECLMRAKQCGIHDSVFSS